ncbi:UPF0449 protein C19orf25 homolog [Microplitis demolitor]|uniref:UPF0449 protein C19orf25 homolog n=1 Tax=Microplitis demolitor TaxID=69319 RepID=UPI0004CD631B|nr:UPF0449 protein C19orf25 homolog [Microplitis demolitor]
MNMFGSKRNNLPPRPSLPQGQQIMEDLKNAKPNDVAFNVNKNDNKQYNLHFPTNVNDAETIYRQARRYLDGIEQLKVLSESINNEQTELQASYQEIVKLAKDIRDQAQAVLVT